VAQTGVALNTLVTSNSITVMGINASSSVSITGGQYSVNGGPYTSAPGSVNNGDSVSVQLMSSGSYATTTNATLTIGGVNGMFSVTTQNAPVDTTPDPFTFVAQTNVALNTLVTSNSIAVTGLNAPSPISVTSGSYSINGGTFTSAVGTVNNGDSVRVQLMSSGSYATTTIATLTIGGVSGTFIVTTQISQSQAYVFSGFFSPVDNLPIVNSAKAGQAVPVKWRLTDSSGTPISGPTSFRDLGSYMINCGSLIGDPIDAIEEYAAGTSGLQYDGDGYWQFNWKTPKTYAGQCRTMVITLGDGSKHEADFKFK
jgi:hypothetical protein